MGRASKWIFKSAVYNGTAEEFGGHEAVNHHKGEYVRGAAHVNSCESFHALLKRGVHGTYHHWSPEHLHRYLSEFDFRFNLRKVEDGTRTLEALKGFEGKRLMYREERLSGLGKRRRCTCVTEAYIDKFVNGESVDNRDMSIWYAGHVTHDVSHDPPESRLEASRPCL